MITYLSLNYDTPVLPEYFRSNVKVYEKRLAYLVLIHFPCF